MKKSIVLIITLLLTSCLFSQNENIENYKEGNFNITKTEDSIIIKNKLGKHSYTHLDYESFVENYLIKEDSIYIEGYEGKIAVSKEEVNDFLIINPEIVCGEVPKPRDMIKNIEAPLFEMEEDFYYLLYAHFVKDRYEEKYKEEQKQIKSLFENLIDLSRYGPRGSGSYHAHELVRAIGKVEYHTYLYAYSVIIPKTGTQFQNEKRAYIQKLWKYLDEGKEAGFGVKDLIESGYYDDEELYTRGKRHLKSVERLISNSFFLKIAQDEFGFD